MADRKGLSYTSAAEAPPNPQLFGLYLGIVTHTRAQDLWVQVNIPQILGPQDSNWARPIGFNGMGTAADGFGAFTVAAAGPGGLPAGAGALAASSATSQGQPAGWCINEVGPGPPVGSLVVVLFLGGDRNRPGYLLTSQSVSGSAIAPVASLAAATSTTSGSSTSTGTGSTAGSTSTSTGTSSGSTTGGAVSSGGGGTSSSGSSAVPNGPSGSWTLVFEDMFPGTSLNTANWTALQGASINNVSTEASAVSVSGGYLRIGYAGAVNSNPTDQYAGPSTGPAVVLGNCIEASINFPNGDNWSAWWADGGDWPANGEEDIAEILGGNLTAFNYHSPAGANNGPTPSGSWFGSFHTYTLVRGSTTLDVYWDGTLQRSVTRDDGGGAQGMIINMGDGSTGNTILVEYVRMWTPG